MEITTKQHGAIIDIMVSGRLDTNTAPQLETAIREGAKDNKAMNLDLSGVEYMSSTGLRDILLAHKIMVSNNGKLIIKNPSAFCMQVLEATNMDKLLTIER